MPEPSVPTTIIELYVFVLACFVGYQVIARVPQLLHTPLMSATNTISGISLVGSLVLAGVGRRTCEHELFIQAAYLVASVLSFSACAA
jgi:NAD/NADP transhydrogenase alpha subunit